MRLLVWGASPQAGWLAARFDQLGYETLWLTETPVAEAVSHFGGLELVSPHQRHRCHDLTIATDIDAVLKPPLAWIILAMPNWAVGNAVSAMVRRIPPEHCPNILLLQHGIGGMEKITTYFDESHIVQGILTRIIAWPIMNNGQIAYETIVSDGLGGTALSTGPQVHKISHMLTLAGMGPVNIHDKDALRWSDILWQIQANALPTLLDVPPEHVYEDQRLFEIEYRQIREALQVIDQLGIPFVKLPGVDVPRLARQIRLLPKSLLPNRLKPNAKPPGLRTDLTWKTGHSDAAYLNGMVAKLAYDMGQNASVNHVLALSLTDIAEGRTPWDQFKGNFAYLETLIRVASRHETPPTWRKQ